MVEVSTEEVLALQKEVEGKLFDVSLIHQEENGQVERILPQVFRYSVVEQSVKDKRKNIVDDKSWDQFVVEEVKVVREESNSVLVFFQEVRICIFYLLLN